MTISLAGMMAGFAILATVLFVLWMYARILAKAGFNGWWALVGLVPVVNFVAVWVFAYSEWPRGGNPVSSVTWPAPAPHDGDVSDRLDALDRLRAEGKISEAEYATKRREILDDF